MPLPPMNLNLSGGTDTTNQTTGHTRGADNRSYSQGMPWWVLGAMAGAVVIYLLTKKMR